MYKFCPNCGKENCGWKFCPECGISLNEEDKISLDKNFGAQKFSGEKCAFDLKDNGNGTHALVKLIDKSKKTATIPETVTHICKNAFLNCRKLEEIIIPDGVKSIGDCAFLNCIGLTQVILPESVKSVGFKAFYGCINLKKVYIEGNLTDIGEDAFLNGCEIVRKKYSPPDIHILDKQGSEKNSFIYNLPDFDIKGGILIKYTGNGGNVLIPDGVKGIAESAFSGCTGLTSVKIPESVKTIGNNAFENCVGLSKIVIPDSIKNLGSFAFRGCNGLQSVSIGKNVRVIERYAFFGCTALKSLTMRNGIECIGNYAFQGCVSLKNITVPDSVKSVGNCSFSGCSFEKATVSTYVGNYMPRYSLKSLIITSGESIVDFQFKNYAALENIILPNSVKSIGKYAFSGCVRLKEIILPNSLEIIKDYAFSRCGCLSVVSIHSKNIKIGKEAIPKSCKIIKR